MENNVQVVEQKLVEFNGFELLGIKANDGKIYVGVRWVCEGVGLSDGQVKAERKKIKEDIVLNQGGRNFVLPTNGGQQDILTLDIDFLPLWLAKITITPNMQKNQPEVASKLVQYQLKAKDVLAEAFIHNSAQQYLSLSEEDRAIAYFTAKKEQKQLQLQIEENKPLVTFAETVLKSKDNILVREMSKLIQDEGINIGEKKLYQKLRDWNLVLTYKNEPTQYAMNQKLFVVEEKSIDTAYGVKLVKTMKITPKGQIRIVEKIKKEYSKSVVEVIQNT
ncbi:hypothetical protein AV545_04130 [Paenibacillus jamilae]|uniref:phage antirepressor N-terminal domain-containing protein n=1 Tax=Paenibacillus jamilae TaxID=114136 RepID=UPI0007ABDF89|nr:phage antirepressor N-terminal domain-containing protein [Paenibacillus jamilae]KZE65118.1 hypothetical protein AV545_04130 [Paenibacillus jamilae]